MIAFGPLDTQMGQLGWDILTILAHTTGVDETTHTPYKLSCGAHSKTARSNDMLTAFQTIASALHQANDLFTTL